MAGKLDALLDSHLLPSGSDSPLWSDDFEAFLQWRQDALWKQIQQVTGVTDAADDYEPDLYDDEEAVALDVMESRF